MNFERGVMTDDDTPVFKAKFLGLDSRFPGNAYIFQDEAGVTTFLSQGDGIRAWEILATVGREVHLIKSQPVLRFGNPDYGTPDRQPQPPSEVQD